MNSELEEIEQALKNSLGVLAPGGRLSIISFHSLEDRIVKRFMREQRPAGSCRVADDRRATQETGWPSVASIRKVDAG